MDGLPVTPVRKKSSKSLILITVLFTLLGGCALLCGGCSMLLYTVSQDTSYMDESVIDKGTPNKKVMVLPIHGAIGMPEAFGPAGTSVARVRELVDIALERDDIVAVLLDVDSPGGTVYASDEIHNLIGKISDRKRVFAHYRSLAASGGYYVSCGAEKIYADPTCLIGSISVRTEVINVEGLLNMIGVKIDVMKTGEYKDIMSPYRPMTDEERKLMQNTIDSMFKRFIDVVAKGRKKTEEDVRSFADGREFLPDEALSLGLIDEIAYRDDVYKDIRNLIGDATFVMYSPPKTLSDLLLGEIRQSSLESRVSSILALHGTRLLMFMME